MQGGGGSLGEVPQSVIKSDDLPAACLSIEQRSSLHRCGECLLQAHGLCTQLYLVGLVSLGPPSLVLDGKGTPPPRLPIEGTPRRRAGWQAVELYHIGSTREAEAAGAEAEAPPDEHISPVLRTAVVHHSVQVRSFHSPCALHPDALEMDEGSLSITEDHVLQSRQRKELVLFSHGRTPLRRRDFPPERNWMDASRARMLHVFRLCSLPCSVHPMQKKLTITIEESVYRGLYDRVGAGRISRFIEDLVRPHVLAKELDDAYAEMARDREREAEALEWSEELLADARNDPR